MGQCRIVTIRLRALWLLENADYPSSLDLALEDGITRMVAELITWDPH